MDLNKAISLLIKDLLEQAIIVKTKKGYEKRDVRDRQHRRNVG